MKYSLVLYITYHTKYLCFSDNKSADCSKVHSTRSPYNAAECRNHIYDIRNPSPFVYFIYPCGFLRAEHPQKSEHRIAPGLARDHAAISTWIRVVVPVQIRDPDHDQDPDPEPDLDP